MKCLYVRNVVVRLGLKGVLEAAYETPGAEGKRMRRTSNLSWLGLAWVGFGKDLARVGLPFRLDVGVLENEMSVGCVCEVQCGGAG